MHRKVQFFHQVKDPHADIRETSNWLRETAALWRHYEHLQPLGGAKSLRENPWENNSLVLEF